MKDYEWQFAPGTEIGPYTIVEPMAVGGMGEVYVARHSYLASRTVALKVLQFLRAQKDDFKDRFRAEASLLADLDHPNVVRLFDAGMTGTTCWMAMELLVGQTLDALGRRLGALSVPNALYILAEVGDGVQAAHEVGVIHRDLKPANIFVTSQHGVKVLDFGTSKFHDRGVKTTDKMRLLGTYAYMSPEHLLNTPIPDHRTDIFAMGIIGCELLLGRHPYSDPDGGIADSRAIGERILAFEPPVLHAIMQDMPEYVGRLFQIALHKNRDARFPAVSDFVRELRAARKRYLAERGVPENAFHLASEEGRRREYTPPASLQPRPPEPVQPSRRVYGPQDAKTEVLSPMGQPSQTALPIPLVQQAALPPMVASGADPRMHPLAYASTAHAGAPLEAPGRQSAPRIEGTPAPITGDTPTQRVPSGSGSWVVRAVGIGVALGVVAMLGVAGFLKLRSGHVDPPASEAPASVPEQPVTPPEIAVAPPTAASAAPTVVDTAAAPAEAAAAPTPTGAAAPASARSPKAAPVSGATALPVMTALPAAAPAPAPSAPPSAAPKPPPKPKTEVLPKSDL